MNIKEKLIATAIGSCIGIILGVAGVLSIQEYFRRYTWKLRSPVIIQAPLVITNKVVKPISKSKLKLQVSPTPQNGTKLKTLSPTPTIPKKRTIVPVVEAAERTGNPIKDYIIEKFGKDSPIMLKIAQCESGTQSYNWYNKWLHNGKGMTDIESREIAERDGYAVGVFMIYRKVHAHLSFDDMLDHKKNTDYAYGLFKANGTNPWNSSRHCWES